jgi:hypothetical protein
MYSELTPSQKLDKLIEVTTDLLPPEFDLSDTDRWHLFLFMKPQVIKNLVGQLYQLRTYRPTGKDAIQNAIVNLTSLREAVTLENAKRKAERKRSDEYQSKRAPFLAKNPTYQQLVNARDEAIEYTKKG